MTDLATITRNYWLICCADRKRLKDAHGYRLVIKNDFEIKAALINAIDHVPVHLQNAILSECKRWDMPINGVMG